nr:ulp1 protease family, C-terminal catalytic domain-containing protein [Tanacetum cinerariifolium]
MIQMYLCVCRRARKEKRQQKQSNFEKEKADIRKRLHLLKEDMDDRSNHVKKVYYQWMGHEDCAMSQFVTIKKEIVWDVDKFTLPINSTDIIELLTCEKLRTNILALFSRAHVLFII